MDDLIFNVNDIDWKEQDTGLFKILVGPEHLINSTIKLFCLRPDEKSIGHEHDFTQIMYFLRGVGKAIVNDIDTRIEPGLVIIVKPNEIHEIVNTGNENLDLIVIETKDPASNTTPFIDF